MPKPTAVPDPKQILLIDSEVNVRSVVQICLSILGGWTVIIAESTQDGFNKATLEQPDLIILDTSISEQMNGQELLAQLTVDPVTRSIPIVLLSVEAAWLNGQQLQQLGAKGAIAKPFDVVTLPTQIASLLGWALPPEHPSVEECNK